MVDLQAYNHLLNRIDSMGSDSDDNELKYLIFDLDINYLPVDCINNRSSFCTKDIRNFEDSLDVQIRD